MSGTVHPPPKRRRSRSPTTEAEAEPEPYDRSGAGALRPLWPACPVRLHPESPAAGASLMLAPPAAGEKGSLLKIGILDEHPEWSKRLSAELEGRGLDVERIDHAEHGYDPRDRRRRWDVVVNRTSPSSHRRAHGRVLFYAEPLLAHLEAVGVPVVNPLAAWRFEKTKALPAEPFARPAVRYPPAPALERAAPLRR